MIHEIALWISGIAALAAAFLWIRSALLLYISDTLAMALSGPNSPAGYMKRQSWWSAWAAFSAAISAVAQVIAIISN
jgi:hypothetical protein